MSNAQAPAAVRPGLRLEHAALLTPTRRRAVRDGVAIAGVLAALVAGVMSFNGAAIDAHAYWVNRPPVSYGPLAGTDDAYLYSPAFAQLLAPVTALPWHAFLALWLAGLLLALRWLTGPLLLLPAVVLFFAEISYANIHFLLALAMVVGFRHPSAWSLVLLTKITPGIGLVWFAARREWRSLAIAAGASAAIAAFSFVLAPGSWLGWIDLLERSAAVPPPTVLLPGPLWLRLAVAGAIVAWGARTDRPWVVPVAAVVALPHGTIGIAMLVAVIPLLRGSRFSPPRLSSQRPAMAG
ncbi:MAG: glycosyltransferase 87 family protein [Chloroflexota bacterium]|nr:glycosyltransferase 87 family protein [Chloroflexota bacterium]